MLINLSSIGQQVKMLRTQASVTQADLAKRAGVSRATINTLENGGLREIGVNRLSTIVEAAKRLSPAPTTPAATLPDGKARILNLSFPYDWSNPALDDDTLIHNVIERGLFEDIVRITAHYGLARIQSIAAPFAANNPMAAASLHRMLGNISKALQHV